MKIVWGRSLGWNIELNKMVKLTQPIPNGMLMQYSIITDGCDCYPWHEVFAYWPVKTIKGRYVWWKKVYKRKVWLVWGHSFHMEPEVQYATVFDMIDHKDETL